MGKKPVEQWDCDVVSKWLQDLSLSSTASITERFIHEGITGDVLLQLTDNDLSSMGLNTGDRIRIMQGISTLRTLRLGSRMSICQLGDVSPEPPVSPAFVIPSKLPVSPVAEALCHPLWGEAHRHGRIPGDLVKWDNAYKKLAEVGANADLWLGFINSSKTKGAGVSDGLFLWGDCQVIMPDDDDPAVIAEEIALDSMYDLTPSRIEQIFTRFDVDRDGAMTAADFGKALKHQGLKKVEPLLKEIIRAVDCTGNGKLRLPEFEVALTKLKLADLLSRCKERSYDASVLDYCAEDVVYTNVIEDLKGFLFHDKPDGFVRWMHLSSVDKELLLFLTIKYHLPPLGVQEAWTLSSNEVSTKVERYGNVYFIMLNYFQLAPTKPRVSFEKRRVVIFVSGGPQFDTVITMTSRQSGEKYRVMKNLWDTLLRKIQSQYVRIREHTADFLMQELVSLCLAELNHITSAFRNRLMYFHITMNKLQAAFPQNHLQEISQISMQLTVLSRGVRPLRHVVKQLLDDPSISGDTRMYLDDARETVEQVVDDIVQLHETCKGLTQEYNRYSDRKLNDSLAILTVASFIFMPVQFISGVYGMNFDVMPELRWRYSYLFFWIFVLLWMSVGCTLAWKLFLSSIFRKEDPFEDDLSPVTVAIHPESEKPRASMSTMSTSSTV